LRFALQGWTWLGRHGRLVHVKRRAAIANAMLFAALLAQWVLGMAF
jgi:hypothetical protein